MHNIVNSRFVARSLLGAAPYAALAASLEANPPTPPAPRAFVSLGGDHGERIDWFAREEVKVTHIRVVAKRFRYARLAFNYTV